MGFLNKKRLGGIPTPKFSLTTTLFITIITLLILTTTSFAADQFNCQHRISYDQYIPVILRGAPIGEFATDSVNTATALQRIQQAIYTLYDIQVRITFGEPITDGNCIPNGLNDGIEILMCKNMNQIPKKTTGSDSPDWSISTTKGWCEDGAIRPWTFSADFQSSDLASYASVPTSYVEPGAQWILSSLNTYFTSCTSSALQCIPRFSDLRYESIGIKKATCGDGIVQDGEECDQHTMYSKGYYTNLSSTIATGLCDLETCKRYNPNLISTGRSTTQLMTLTWSQTGYQRDYLSDCLTNACGKNYLPISFVTYTTQSCTLRGCTTSEPKNLTPDHGWHHYALPIPLPPPIKGGVYSGYEPLYCYGQNGCNSADTPTWRCRSSSTESWGNCQTTNQSKLYALKDSNVTIDPSDLGLNQLVEITADNFTCGIKYALRYVSCTRGQNPVSDISCVQNQKPISIIIAEVIPCTGYWYVDIYGLSSSTQTTQIFQQNQFISITSSQASLSLVGPTSPSRPANLCSISTQDRTPFETCFASCTSFHQRIVKCMSRQPVIYTQSGTPVSFNNIPTFETSQSLVNIYCGGNASQFFTTSEKTDGKTCRNDWMCNSIDSLTTVGKCKDINICSCLSKDYEEKDPGCYLHPPDDYLTTISIDRKPILSSAESKCTVTSPAPIGYNPNTVDYPINGNPFPVPCIDWKTNTGLCYRTDLVYTKPADNDDAPASNSGPKDSTIWNNPGFDQFCDSKTFKFKTPPFQTKCVNTKININEDQTDLSSRCTAAQVSNTLICSISTEQLRCKVTPVPGTSAQILSQVGYRPDLVTFLPSQCHPSQASFASFLTTSQTFCGEIKWEVLDENIKCFKQNGSTFIERPRNECSEFTPEPVTIQFRGGCELHCYDKALTHDLQGNEISLDKHLGPCSSSTIINFSELICGSTFTSDLCTFHTKTVGTKCFTMRSGILIQVNDDYCSLIPPPLKLTNNCFKLSPLIGIDSPATLSDLMLLEQESRSMPNCRFRPLCNYSYSDKPGQIEATLHSNTQILARDRTTNACSIDFDCKQLGVCGSVQRNAYCGFFSNNNLVSWGRQSSSATSRGNLQTQSTLDDFYEDSDDNSEITQQSYYTLSIPQTVDLIGDDEISRRAEQYGIEHPPTLAYYDDDDSNDDHRMQTQQTLTLPTLKNTFQALMAQFLVNAGNDGTCGTVRSISSCDATKPANCFVPRCYVPTGLSETKAEVDALPDSAFDADACDVENVQRHCLLNVGDQICDNISIDVHYRCYDISQNTLADNASNCGLEFGTVTNILQQTCTVVRGCDSMTDQCFWRSNNGGIDTLVHPLPSSHSDFTCLDIDTIKSDIEATQEFCNGLNFCGSARTASNCVFTRNADPSQSITEASVVISAELCSQYKPINPGDLENTFHNYALAENTLTCNNYNACSTWACSQPGTEASVTKITTNINNMNNQPISTNLIARAFFSQDTGVITGNNCASQLSPTASSQTECGVISTYRQVGCLSMKTSSQFAQPTYYFDPNATTCGSMDSQNRELLPLKMHVLRSDVGCPRTLECGPGSVAYGTAACDYIHCPASYLPDASTTSSFPYDHNLKCKGPATDPSQPQPLLPLSQCSSSNTSTDLNPVSVSGKSIPPHTTCLFIQPFCKKNLQIPMGFGPNANMTDTSGKYFPEDHAEYTKPLSLRLMLDAGCSQSSATFQQAFMTNDQNQIANTNRNMAQGESFTLGLSYTYHSLSLSMAVYLVPISFTDFTPTTWQFPYLITQLPPSTNPRYTITIPDWIPNGKYYVVVYGNVFMMQWVPETIITVVRTTPLTLIPVTTTPTTPTSPPRVTDGVYGDCAGYLCLHGTCALPLGVVSNGIDSTLPGSNYTCQCKPGFAGKYCAQTDTCEAAATAAATYQPPYTNEDGEPVTPLYCNKQYGIVTTTLASTSYSTTSATKPVCSMCQCLGTFDSADGCSTCALQCGVGTPDATCTKCTCPIDRSGSRCECTSKRFTIFYRLPPPFIQDMFKRSDNQFIPINVYEQAQLITWKKSLIFDIATDFSMPADMFEVESYGSDTTAFGVVIKLTICSPFPSVTTTLTHDESIATQGKQLDLAFAAFTTAFKALQTAGRSNGPLVGYSNEEVNHLQWYKPSFDAVNLAGRFRAAAVTPSASIAANYINPITGDILEDDEEFSADDVSNHFNQQQQLFSSLQTPDVTIATGIEPTIAGKFQYLHSAITASPVSDANGGFTDISDIYSSSQCTTGCILPSHPVLTPSEPTPWKAKPKPFNSDILLYTFVPLLFVLIFGLAILLCCTWKYQTWCFTGYKDRKDKERKAHREARRNNRSGKTATTQTAAISASHPTSNNIGSTTPSGITSQTPGFTPQKQKIDIDAGAAAGANITGDYHPEDFEDDDEAADYFAEGTEVEVPSGPTGPGPASKFKRQSIAIGGMKRVSVVGLPKGWSLLNLDGKQIYVNTETMQSSSVKPLPDGTIPVKAEDKGW